MKNKEMAEEYLRKHWSDNVTEMNNQYSFQQVKGAPHFYDNAIKQAFLAGLKTGRPQWHDLRKDPNDLPKRNKDFVVEVTIPVMTHPSYVFATYYFDNRKWFSFGEEIKVIAWCEIPTFDKE